MEISPENQHSDDESLNFLEAFSTIADIVSECQEADFSGVSPSESKQLSAQHWTYLFGVIVAWYALQDKKWRLNLFNEGEFIIEGKPTKIWVWDDIWGDSDEKGAPNRKVPLVVGSLLSDSDGSRDWKALREHYLCMWSGSYTSYGKPLSEVGPEDDLYCAMRIGFADKMLQQPNPSEDQNGISGQLATIKDIQTGMSLRQLKQHQENQKQFQELLERLPPNAYNVGSQLKQRLGEHIELVPEQAVNYCVNGELAYNSRTGGSKEVADAIIWFGKSAAACLEDCLVNPFLKYSKDYGEKLTIDLQIPQGQKNLKIVGARYWSLSDWAYILELLNTTMGSSSSNLGVVVLKKFMKEHFGYQRFPDFRSLGETLHKIQQYRNKAVHPPTVWENHLQDLEEMRSLVLGIGGQTSVLVLIPRLLAQQKQ